MVKKYFLPALIIIALYLFFPPAFGQTVLLEQDVNADTVPLPSGPNLKNYSHSYIRYGFVVGQPEDAGMEIMMGSSTSFTFGIRYKRRIANFYSLGFDVNYNIVNFRLKQDSSKNFPQPHSSRQRKICV